MQQWEKSVAGIKAVVPDRTPDYYALAVGKKTVSLRRLMQEFPGGAVVRTLHFQCRGRGLIPGLGTKIPHATWHNQNLKTKK